MNNKINFQSKILITFFIIFSASFALMLNKIYDDLPFYFLRILPFIQTSIIFFTAYLVGEPFMRFLRFKIFSKDLDAVLAIVFGLGIISLLTLCLGMAGFLNKQVISLFVIVLILFSIKKTILIIKEFFKWLREHEVDPFDFKWKIIAFIFSIIILIYLCAAIVPETNYDVLEYHLAVPEQDIRVGEITPQPYNFYANMPFGVEMIYTFGMLFEGGASAETPKIINFGFLILSLFLLNGIMRELYCVRIIRAFCIILYLCILTTFRMSVGAFADLGVTIFVASAVLLFLISLSSSRKRCLIFASFFLGFASCCKYPAIGIWVIPYLLILLPIATAFFLKDKWNYISKKSFVKLYALLLFFMGLFIFIIFLPWMIKNTLYAGNPVYPFFSKIFGSDLMNYERSQKIISVHGTVSLLSIAYLKAIFGKLNLVGWIFLLPIIALFKEDYLFKKKTLALWLYLAGAICVWATVKDSPDRFFAPGFLIICGLTGGMINSFYERKYFKSLIVLPYFIFIFAQTQMMFFNLVNYDFLSYALGSMTQEEYLKKNLKGYYDAVEYINKELPDNSKIFFVYEARTFYIEKEVMANTVHDTCPLYEIAKVSTSGEEIINTLKQQGFTHILVNEIELQRIEASFGAYFPYDDYEMVKPKLDEFFKLIFADKCFEFKAPAGEFEGKEIYISEI